MSLFTASKPFKWIQRIKVRNAAVRKKLTILLAICDWTAGHFSNIPPVGNYSPPYPPQPMLCRGLSDDSHCAIVESSRPWSVDSENALGTRVRDIRMIWNDTNMFIFISIKDDRTAAHSWPDDGHDFADVEDFVNQFNTKMQEASRSWLVIEFVFVFVFVFFLFLGRGVQTYCPRIHFWKIAPAPRKREFRPRFPCCKCRQCRFHRLLLEHGSRVSWFRWFGVVGDAEFLQ